LVIILTYFYYYHHHFYAGQSPWFQKLQKEHAAGMTTTPADHQPKNCCVTTEN